MISSCIATTTAVVVCSLGSSLTVSAFTIYPSTHTRIPSPQLPKTRISLRSSIAPNPPTADAPGLDDDETARDGLNIADFVDDLERFSLEEGTAAETDRGYPGEVDSRPDSGQQRTDNNPSTKFGSPISDGLKEINKAMIGLLKGALFDTVYAGEDRAYARFYALETIARMPYFSYLSILHLYETLGTWRKAKYLKLHFAEGDNELHHLMIMEELGGNDLFFDRFLAQHIAFGYFAMVCVLYLINPVEAYNLNEDVEQHAFETYDAFLKENALVLKSLPAPKAAIEYYVKGDMYMFDAFQTGCEIRRPEINNLYDTFAAIRDDEAAHVNTMKQLQTELDVPLVHDEECQLEMF